MIDMLRRIGAFWTEEVGEARTRSASFANKGWAVMTRKNANERLPRVCSSEVHNVGLVTRSFVNIY